MSGVSLPGLLMPQLSLLLRFDVSSRLLLFSQSPTLKLSPRSASSMASFPLRVADLVVGFVGSCNCGGGVCDDEGGVDCNKGTAASCINNGGLWMCILGSRIASPLQRTFSSSSSDSLSEVEDKSLELLQAMGTLELTYRHPWFHRHLHFE